MLPIYIILALTGSSYGLFHGRRGFRSTVNALIDEEPAPVITAYARYPRSPEPFNFGLLSQAGSLYNNCPLVNGVPDVHCYSTVLAPSTQAPPPAPSAPTATAPVPTQAISSAVSQLFGNCPLTNGVGDVNCMTSYIKASSHPAISPPTVLPPVASSTPLSAIFSGTHSAYGTFTGKPIVPVPSASTMAPSPPPAATSSALGNIFSAIHSAVQPGITIIPITTQPPRTTIITTKVVTRTPSTLLTTKAITPSNLPKPSATSKNNNPYPYPDDKSKTKATTTAKPTKTPDSHAPYPYPDDKSKTTVKASKTTTKPPATTTKNSYDPKKDPGIQKPKEGDLPIGAVCDAKDTPDSCCKKIGPSFEVCGKRKGDQECWDPKQEMSCCDCGHACWGKNCCTGLKYVGFNDGWLECPR